MNKIHHRWQCVQFTQNLHQQITKCKILMAAHAMVDSARGPLTEETLTR